MRELAKDMRVEQPQFTRRGFLIGGAAGVGTAGLTYLGLRPAEAQTRAPISSKEVTNLFTLEEKRFEGTLGPSWSNAWQDSVSGKWRKLYDIGILERDGDSNPSFVPVLDEIWNKGAESLLDSPQYGMSIPSPQSVSEFPGLDKLLAVVDWFRDLAEMGPIRTYGVNKLGRKVMATDRVALFETSTGEPFFLPLGRIANAPELELVPRNVEVFPWPERFGDLERDGMEFINKGKKTGLTPGDPELYQNILWARDNYAEYPNIHRRLITYDSVAQMNQDPNAPHDPSMTMLWLWDVWATPTVREDGILQQFPPTFKDGQLRFKVLPDGTQEFHLSMPEPLSNVTPHPSQLLKLSVPLGDASLLPRMLFSTPDIQRVAGDVRYSIDQANKRDSDPRYQIIRLTEPKDGYRQAVLPIYIVIR